jgi:hypothetical protein
MCGHSGGRYSMTMVLRFRSPLGRCSPGKISKEKQALPSCCTVSLPLPFFSLEIYMDM